MHAEWVGPVVLVVLGILLVWFFVVALVKARRRRREELRETEDEQQLPSGKGEEGPPGEEEGEEPPEEPPAANEQRRPPEEQRPAAKEKGLPPEEKKPRRDEKQKPPAEERKKRREEQKAPPREERKKKPPRDERKVAAPEELPAAEEAPAPVADEALQRGLERTSSSLFGRLNQIFRRHPQVDRAVLDELEEALLTADVGVSLTTRLVDVLRKQLDAHELDTADAVRASLKARMLEALEQGAGSDPLTGNGKHPRVILFVGVNGVGKTTTIGKVAAKLSARGSSVLLAAGDTFRAAAVEQLQIWGERAGCRVIRGETGADPASVIFNAVDSATQSGSDFMLADTAGRLHTKTELMDEIKKVKRAASKAREGAPDEVWLVVDATTGQNALQQAREFHQALGLTGVILTKLDGTAKGGVVVAIADTLKIPVRFVGVGEKPEDLRPFEPHGFVEALFSSQGNG